MDANELGDALDVVDHKLVLLGLELDFIADKLKALDERVRVLQEDLRD
jgi:hypothetical protein